MRKLTGSTIFVTGANGGLGEEWVAQGLQRGAAKIYAADLVAKAWDDHRVIALALDITDAASVERAARRATDTTVLVNNAGVSLRDPLLTGEESALRHAFDVNFFGTLSVARAFAPTLVRNGGGAMLNVISLLSWLSISPGYSATKAALWSATNAIRLELATQGVDVVALHMGYTATPMTTALDVPKNDPADVVRAGLDGVETGAYEVLADEWSARVKAALSGPIQDLYPQLSGGSLPFGQPDTAQTSAVR